MPEKKKAPPPARKFNRTIHIKVDEQTSATLDRISKAEERSVTNLAQRLIKGAVAAIIERNG
jgi:predicted HicB family RNase H-like nuclease